MWNYSDYTEEECKTFAADVAEHFFTITFVPFSDFFLSYIEITPTTIEKAIDTYSAALSLGSFILFDTVFSYPFQSIGTYGNLPSMICDHIALSCIHLSADKKPTKNGIEAFLPDAKHLQETWHDMHNKIPSLLSADNGFHHVLDAFYAMSKIPISEKINVQFARLFVSSYENFDDSMDKILHYNNNAEADT